MHRCSNRVLSTRASNIHSKVIEYIDILVSYLEPGTDWISISTFYNVSLNELVANSSHISISPLCDCSLKPCSREIIGLL